MEQKHLSNQALAVINQYLNFKIGKAVCSVPYFNNKKTGSRAALRAFIGKGSPEEIAIEVETILLKNRINRELLTDHDLKKIMTDNNLGIECSGFVYHILNAHCHSTNNDSIKKHLNFPECTGLLGKIRCSFRPAENCNVATFAHDSNSQTISSAQVRPGDIITMTNGGLEKIRDHILIIHQVDYLNGIPAKIHYSHSIAYPADGLYNTGVRQGAIEITDINQPITAQRWTEGNDQSVDLLVQRAQKSKTEIRRLRF